MKIYNLSKVVSSTACTYVSGLNLEEHSIKSERKPLAFVVLFFLGVSARGNNSSQQHTDTSANDDGMKNEQTYEFTT